MTTVLTAARLITPTEEFSPGVILLDGEHIRAAGPRAAIEIPHGATIRDFGDATLAPGFIDIHIHGGTGIDLMTAARDEVAAFIRHLARHGVTSFCPTTVTAAWPDTLAAVERLSHLGPAALGVHLEGPFLSPTRRGVHPPDLLLDPSLERLDQLCAAGHLALITLAPELPGAIDFIAAATARGIRVSLGHSDATFEQAQAAFAAGAHHLTHTFNAMRPLHHRDPGLLAAALLAPDISLDVIADTVHVAPPMLELLFRLAGPERSVLISDAVAATGCPAGRYRLGPIDVEVSGNQCHLLGDPTRLAGSVLTLDEAVRNVVQLTAMPMRDALRMATQNPARLLGIATKGRLTPGADADLVVLSPSGKVLSTFRAAQQVH